MEKQLRNDDIPSIRIKPDFKALRSTNYRNTSDVDYKEYVKHYKRNNYLIELYFMTSADVSKMLINIHKVFAKYQLLDHEMNLSYLLIEAFRQTYIEATEVRIPNRNNPKRAILFATFIDFLLAHPNKQFKVSFTEVLNEETIHGNKRYKQYHDNKSASKADKNGIVSKVPKAKISPINYTCDDGYISRWLIDSAIKTVEEGGVSLQMGYQLINSQIVEDTNRKRKVFRLNAPENAFEDASESSIWADAIADVCFPIINYLKAVTDLKDDSVKMWSGPQLKVLVELMIAIGYVRTSSNKPFEFGVSDPSSIDKKRLSATLTNKFKQRKAQATNDIDKSL